MENPKEEPKQDLREYPLTPDESFKQETLEEFAERYRYGDSYKNILRGAKWQQERSYSEEEVLVILHKRDMYEWEKENEILSMINWFKQFKKK